MYHNPSVWKHFVICVGMAVDTLVDQLTVDQPVWFSCDFQDHSSGKAKFSFQNVRLPPEVGQSLTTGSSSDSSHSSDKTATFVASLMHSRPQALLPTPIAPLLQVEGEKEG